MEYEYTVSFKYEDPTTGNSGTETIQCANVNELENFIYFVDGYGRPSKLRNIKISQYTVTCCEKPEEEK